MRPLALVHLNLQRSIWCPDKINTELIVCLVILSYRYIPVKLCSPQTTMSRGLTTYSHLHAEQSAFPSASFQNACACGLVSVAYCCTKGNGISCLSWCRNVHMLDLCICRCLMSDHSPEPICVHFVLYYDHQQLPPQLLWKSSRTAHEFSL